ncbi:MAG: prepilin-type N-terminal cleavage/methylation domain-containing protein [Pirellulaceae bacterium]|nr:prepilin-type N-terminal cleavage/methylation domain-containing protein [Pirellulaceae bacterium]
MSSRGRLRRCRPGLTLVEVLIASSILVMALASLGQLQSSGVRAAMVAGTEAQAIVLCQSELDRYRAGISPPAQEALMPIPGTDHWSSRIYIEPTASEGISAVTVEVYRHPIGSNTKPAARLTHWIRQSPSASVSFEMPIP